MATAPDIAKQTAQAVSQAMVAANVGRKRLSDLTSISYGTLGRKLAGVTAFDIVDLYMIARALNVPPADFLPPAFQSAERVAS